MGGQIIANRCVSCGGSGHTQKKAQIAVKIPAGVDTGQRLKLTGEGEAGDRGGQPGDLYVTINILEHEFFTREEADVLCDVPVTFVQASLGAEIDVPTLEGKVKLKIPAGTQSHKTLRLKNKCLDRLGSYGRGDQLVRIIVEVTSNLNKDQGSSKFEPRRNLHTPCIGLLRRSKPFWLKSPAEFSRRKDLRCLPSNVVEFSFSQHQGLSSCLPQVPSPLGPNVVMGEPDDDSIRRRSRSKRSR